MQKMKVGLFDPIEGQKWTQLGTEALNSSYAQLVSFEAALQGIVLLKNQDQSLPFKPGLHVAVVGPMAFETQGLLSDYANRAIEPNGMQTIADAITTANQGGVTTSSLGVDIDSADTKNVAAALKVVKEADVTVLVLGITHTQGAARSCLIAITGKTVRSNSWWSEHEGIDRKDTRLPGMQEKFALEVLV